jgi:two-component system, OmpR family, sensor histidine kinase KdpD
MTPEESADLTSHVADVRGRHKIFIGYAAGVGKTYTMLSEAQRRHSRGEDVVIGFVEPHKRPETIALTKGLDRVPTHKIQYRGATFEELDTDAIIARRPEWVLVDELAHTNVPGSRHEKRWQSVEEILDAGINVISTVNVQHFESLNDTVAQITGVRVRETVPDRILDAADEVELVDITPQALINRLNRGVIYEPAKVPTALEHFFRRGNLVALRELALRRTAEEVDDDLQEFMEGHEVDKTWGATERVLVAITPQPLGAKLIRRGYQLARRMNGRFFVVYVRPQGVALSAKEEALLRDLTYLALDLGGEFVELAGADPATEIIGFAKTRQVTFIVMGQSARSRFDEVVRGSVVNRIMRETRNIDIVVVADAERDTRTSDEDEV